MYIIKILSQIFVNVGKINEYKKWKQFQFPNQTFNTSPQINNLFTSFFYFYKYRKSMINTLIQRKYQFEGEIGRGTSAIIYAARNKETKELTCCKIISKRKAFEATDEKHIETEINALRQIDHPLFAKLYEYFEDENYYYIFEEFCEGRTLLDFINNRILMFGGLNETEVKQILKQLMIALNYLHSKSISHRDLKPENIIVDHCLTSYVKIKIIDFGLSAISDSENDLCQTFCGSLHYAAPEVIRNQPYFGSAADMWSAGIVFYAMIANCLPFDDENATVTANKIIRADFQMPEKISKEAETLLKGLMNPNPEKRITAEQALRSDFLKDVILGDPTIRSYPNIYPPLKGKSLERLPMLSNSSSAYKVHDNTKNENTSNIKRKVKPFTFNKNVVNHISLKYRVSHGAYAYNH